MKVRVRKGRSSWRMIATVDGHDVSADSGVRCYPSNSRGREKAMEMAHEWAKGLAPRPSIPRERTLAAYCETHVATMLATGQIERSTARGYSTSLRYISEYFRDMLVDDVATGDVEGFVLWLRDERGLSQNTVKKSYNILRHCLTHAVKSRDIAWNPCDAMPAPRQRKVPPNALTEAGRRVFVARMRELDLTDEVTGVWIAYYTGMRRGEVCALRWSDVALAEGGCIAHVRGSIGVGMGGTYAKCTKTRTDRVVPIPSDLADVLRRRRAAMLEECMSAGVPFDPGLYVCGTVDGRWLNPPRLSKWFQAHRDEWGLMGTQGTPPTLHGLRHTYATEAVRALDVKTAQSIMGHAQVQMTMEYATTDSARVAAAGAAMEEALTDRTHRGEPATRHQSPATRGMCG